jgi:hypothetical protein
MHIAALGIHAPRIPIPVNSTHTGASTDEPQLNMMREMTDGAREIAQFNLPFMDGTHECILSLLLGQQLFQEAGRLRLVLDRHRNFACKVFIISRLCHLFHGGFIEARQSFPHPHQ